MTRFARPWRVLVVALLVVGVAACGLSEDSGPKAIATGDIPAELLDPDPSTSTSTAQAPNAEVIVYYLTLPGGEPRLQGVSRSVADPTSAAARLTALLAPPTQEEQAAGITTSIPADTRLLGTQLSAGEPVLTVNLSSEVFDVQGQELRNAFAQLVWTATDIDGVSRVRFQVDGEEARAPDSAGVEQARTVGRADYEPLRPL